MVNWALASLVVLLQHVVEKLLQHYSFPLLLVVLVQRVMAVSPQQLLQRLQDKAANLGDPNPWLVQVGGRVCLGGGREVMHWAVRDAAACCCS